MKTYSRYILVIPALLLVPFFLYNNCGNSGASGGSGGGAIVQVQMKISSGGITVGANEFKFDRNISPFSGIKIPNLIEELLWSTADASVTTYRVSPDKAKLRITNITFQSVETNVDTSVESAFNTNQICEIDYDSTNPNQTYICTVELQVGLHYKTIDFKVAPNVDIYINDSTHSLYTTAAGVTTSNPGASLDYFTATYGNNTSFHAELPFTLDTSMLSTELSKITTLDACSNVIEVKMALSNNTVLSDVTYTPGVACGTPGTSTSTVNIGTQELNVVVDMIHGVQVDNSGGSFAVNTTDPWWTIVGTVGAGVSVKHFATTSSGLTSATYQFPPPYVGIDEVKVAYANGVAVAAQMVPNGFNTTTFCKEDYDTPNNSPANGYVGSDSNGAAWAVGPYTVGVGMTSYSGVFYMNTTTNVFYCKGISTDPNPAPSQSLDTFSSNMPVPDGTWKSQNMSRID